MTRRGKKRTIFIGEFEPPLPDIYQNPFFHLLIYFNHLQARIPINTEQVPKRKTNKKEK